MSTLPTPSPLAVGAVAAVYGNDGISKATQRALAPVAESRCSVAMLHSGPDDLAEHGPTAAAAIRATVSGIDVWVAIGCDYKLRQMRLAGQHYDGDAVVRHLSTIADTARRSGAARIMLDPEGELEALGRAIPQLATQIIEQTLAEIARRAPGIPVAVTSFDQLNFHQSMPIAALLGARSLVDAYFPQVYAAAVSGYCGRGALERRETKMLGAMAIEIRKGLARADVEEPDTATDLDVYPYLQLHGVPAVDTIRVGVERRYVAGWALGSEGNAEELYDAQGRTAWRCICALRRYGFIGPDAVSRFERAAGLKVDADLAGIAGPQVQTALLALS